MVKRNHRMEVIYVTPRGREGEPSGVFVSPDGEGRTWYDTVEEAKDDTGITKVVNLAEHPED